MKETVTYTCFICDRPFELGHGAWSNGRNVPIWQEPICHPCDNHDGVVPSPGLLTKLAAKGIIPARNSRGFIILPR